MALSAQRRTKGRPYEQVTKQLGCRSASEVSQNAAGGAGRPAPALPQPPAKALAVPTTLGLNMQELQNWQHTKQASAKPMAQRVMMNVAESVTMDMQNTARRPSEKVRLEPQNHLQCSPRRAEAATVADGQSCCVLADDM